MLRLWSQRKGTRVAPRQLMLQGKPMSFHDKHHRVICLNYFAPKSLAQQFTISLYRCLLILHAAPLAEEPKLLEEVASIGKDVAEGAAKIVAAEGQEHTVRDIQEAPKEA